MSNTVSHDDLTSLGMDVSLAKAMFYILENIKIDNQQDFVRNFSNTTNIHEFTSSLKDQKSLLISGLIATKQLWHGTLNEAYQEVENLYNTFPEEQLALLLINALVKKKDRAFVLQLDELSRLDPPQATFTPCHEFAGDIGSVMMRQYPLGVYKIKNAIITGPRAVISTKSGYMLEEQNSVGNPVEDIHFKYIAPEANQVKHIPLAICLCSPCTYCFYHWVMDSLPKVILAEASGFTGQYIIPANGTFIIESMLLLGINPERFELYSVNRYEVDEIWVPTYWRGDRIYIAPKLFWKFRNTLLKAIDKHPIIPAQKVYISRRLSEKQRVIKNEEEISHLLSSVGFKKVFMEDLSFAEQVLLMRDTDFLVGPHGSGLLHLIFMPPKSTVVEFLEPNYINHLFYGFSKLLQHRHYSLVSSTDGPYRYGKHIEVPILPLEHIIDSELK